MRAMRGLVALALSLSGVGAVVGGSDGVDGASCSDDTLLVWGHPDSRSERDWEKDFNVDWDSDDDFFDLGRDFVELVPELGNGGFSEDGKLVYWLVSRDQFLYFDEEYCDSGVDFDEDRDQHYLSSEDPCEWDPYFGNGYAVLPCCDDDCLDEPYAVNLGPQFAVDRGDRGRCCTDCATPEAAAYARTNIYADEPGRLELQYVMNDAGAIWVNGVLQGRMDSCGEAKPLGTGGTSGDARWQTFSFDVHEGRNPIMVKVRNNNAAADMGFIVQLGHVSPEAPSNFHLDLSVDLSTAEPTAVPTRAPTGNPTAGPSREPTEIPSSAPTLAPSSTPSAAPSTGPTDIPSLGPTEPPSSSPSLEPSSAPSVSPSASPTGMPSVTESSGPTSTPSQNPTGMTLVPSAAPSAMPTSTAQGDEEPVSAGIANLPLVVDTCDSITADASPSQGINLSFSWKLLLETDDEGSILLRTSGSSLFLIDAGLLAEKVGRTLTVELAVRSNETGKRAVAHQSFYVSEESVPLVTIHGGSYQSATLASSRVSLSGLATLPADCGGSSTIVDTATGQMDYLWSLDSADNDNGASLILPWTLASAGITATNADLDLPSNLLVPGYIYTFTLEATFGTAEAAGRHLVDRPPGRASVTMFIEEQGLSAVILGGSTQQTVSGESFRLVCSGADLDYSSVPVRFSWRCDAPGGDADPTSSTSSLDLTPPEAWEGEALACVCSVRAGEAADQSRGVAIAEVSVEVVQPEEVAPPRVSLRLRADGKRPKTTQSVWVVNVDDYISVLGSVRFPGLLREPGDVVDVAWSLTEVGAEAATAFTSSTFDLLLEPGALSTGATYDAVLTVTPTVRNSSPATATIRFRVNAGPTDGRVVFALADGGLLEGSGASMVQALETELRISLVDAADPDGIEGYEFWLRGCDAAVSDTVSGATVAFSGSAEGESYRLSQITTANTLTSILPPASAICPDTVAAAADRDFDVLVIGVEARDGRGASTEFMAGILLTRPTPSPTMTPAVDSSPAPTGPGGVEVDCRTALAASQRALRNGEGILSVTWMLALTSQNDASSADVTCKGELLELVDEALGLDLVAPADLACQTMNLIIEGEDVADDLPASIIELALSLLAQITDAASAGIAAEVGYEIFRLLRCLLTSIEYLSSSEIAAADASFRSSAALVQSKVGVELLRQMVPGQEPLLVDAPGSSVSTKAVSEPASNANSLVFSLGGAVVTLPSDIAEIIEAASAACVDLDEDSEADLGLLGGLRPNQDPSGGPTMSLLLTICSGVTDLLRSPALSSFILDLELETGNDVANSVLPILVPGGAIPTVNASVECRGDHSAPYNVTAECEDEDVLYECDGVTSGTVVVTCPYSALEGSCRRFDATTDAWTTEGCEFLGVVDGRAQCRCDVSSGTTRRHLQDDDGEPDSLDFEARFNDFRSNARFTFTAASSVTAKDAARASVVLIAVGSLLVAYVLALGIGHRLDKQERAKRKQVYAADNAQIRLAMRRLFKMLRSERVAAAQQNVLGIDAFESLGLVDGSAGDACSRFLLCIVDFLFPIKNRDGVKLSRALSSRRGLFAPGEQDADDDDDVASLPSKTSMLQRMGTSIWGSKAVADEDETSARRRSSFIGWFGAKSPEALRIETNPMRKHSGEQTFRSTYDASNSSHATQRSSASSDEESGNHVLSAYTPRADPRLRTTSGAQPLFRMRSSRAPSRATSFATTPDSSSKASSFYIKDDVRPSMSSFTLDGHIDVEDDDETAMGFEDLNTVLSAAQVEVADMQRMRPNFSAAIVAEHEVVSIFRYHASDATIDDVYNAGPRGSMVANTPGTERGSEGATEDVESTGSMQNQISGAGIWARAQEAWSNATRPQKITLLFLELVTIMVVDALFYSGTDDLIVTEGFWANIGSGNSSKLARDSVAVIFFAIFTAFLALPPTFVSLGIYNVKREMRSAETVARRILLHAENQLDWEAQLQQHNSAADLAVALLETLAILQLAQNQDYTELVPHLQRQAAALELLRNASLAREMSTAAEVAAAAVGSRKGADDDTASQKSMTLRGPQTWLERRRQATKACDEVARRHEEDVRDGLCVLMTPAERERVRLDAAAKRVLEIIEALEEQEKSKGGKKGLLKDIDTSVLGPELAEGVGVVIAKEHADAPPPSFAAAIRSVGPRPSVLYDDYVSTFARPSIYSLAHSYKCPVTAVAKPSCLQRLLGRTSKDSLVHLGKRRKKLAVASFYAVQALWGGFCIAYTLLFALTRSEVATAWFFSWIIATVFEVLYVSPIIIFACHVLAPATAGLVISRGLERAKAVLASGQALANGAKTQFRRQWRAGSHV